MFTLELFKEKIVYGERWVIKETKKWVTLIKIVVNGFH